MSQSDINIACNVILNTNPAFPIAWENSQSDQTATHYQVSFLPAETENVSVDFDGSQDLTGIYQVLIAVPLNTGMADNITGEVDLLEKFKRGTQLLHNNQIAEVEKTYTAPAFENGEWRITPVSIEYRGFVRGDA